MGSHAQCCARGGGGMGSENGNNSVNLNSGAPLLVPSIPLHELGCITLRFHKRKILGRPLHYLT